MTAAEPETRQEIQGGRSGCDGVMATVIVVAFWRLDRRREGRFLLALCERKKLT